MNQLRIPRHFLTRMATPHKVKLNHYLHGITKDDHRCNEKILIYSEIFTHRSLRIVYINFSRESIPSMKCSSGRSAKYSSTAAISSSDRTRLPTKKFFRFGSSWKLDIAKSGE